MANADALIASLQDINGEAFTDNAERIRARYALYDALRKVQTPWDIAWDHIVVKGGGNAAIKTLIDAGVFEKWHEAGGGPVTCDELAKLTTGADALLIRRMMRAIAGQRLVIETDIDTYARTPWARALGEDAPLLAMYGGFYGELTNPMFRSLPYFLKETVYKNPTDRNNCNFQRWQGDPDAVFFKYVGTNPLLTSDFNDVMECHSRDNLTAWPNVYSTERLVDGAHPCRALVVDIGGGRRHDLKKFHLRHPQVPARNLILQDLPDFLKASTYDFFTPQPVRGARAYFLHNVLHDWPDPTAVEILRTTAEAMEGGYSKLLIHESLISEKEPLCKVTATDMIMMAELASAERTEGQWCELIASAGLRVVKIWRPVQAVESVIETELA
ncbi:O-methyltransferase af390-400 [Colletotrichum spaethianum]|uniref:O-methyltransferase af390-400 n=1 Tax=Colletotrichum spaethianum TaxID=700344 RepID=A0AA37UKE1_9PEZI|nr:O-methyltransferase af390-400 [Colletotrichum spaethianum]GKT51134.1 O-methyltransferase af390-400 [Colletotrichum spaethianum]